MTPGQIASYKAACAEYDAPTPTGIHAIPTAEEVAVTEALGRIDEAIEGLYDLAALIQARPELADRIRLRGYDINIFVGDHAGEGEDVPDHIASLASDAALHGGIVSQRHGGDYGGVQAMFGPFPLHVYAPLDQVGTATTRTVEVTGWQPHPAIAKLGGGAK